MSIVYYDGKFGPTSLCSLPISDLSIQRGVGVFTTMRVYGRRIFALDKNIERIRKSTQLASINFTDEMIAAAAEVVRVGAKRHDCPDDGDCMAKIFVTGGDTCVNNTFPEPRWFVTFEPAHAPTAEDRARGIALAPIDEQRPFPHAKTIDYLLGYASIAGVQGVQECLYCPGGVITEAHKSNFHVVKGHTIITAPLDCVLDGITRGIVLGLARENGYEVEERCPTLAELADVDEAFITGSIREVMPVVRVGDRQIGTGKPGDVARSLQEIFTRARERWLDK